MHYKQSLYTNMLTTAQHLLLVRYNLFVIHDKPYVSLIYKTHVQITNKLLQKHEFIAKQYYVISLVALGAVDHVTWR